MRLQVQNQYSPYLTYCESLAKVSLPLPFRMIVLDYVCLRKNTVCTVGNRSVDSESHEVLIGGASIMAESHSAQPVGKRMTVEKNIGDTALVAIELLTRARVRPIVHADDQVKTHVFYLDYRMGRSD